MGNSAGIVPEPLVGQQFTLRPFTEKHISPRYIGWLNDPNINRFLEVRFTHQTYETVLAYVQSYYGDTEKYMWGIFPKDSNEPMGTATLYDINRIHGTSEFGILIGEIDYWGKGASTEVIGMILSFAFETLGLRRVTGGCYALNHGMNFTFKRLGFTFEGKHRGAFYVGPGTYIDGYHWGILADEWQAKRKAASSSGD